MTDQPPDTNPPDSRVLGWLLATQNVVQALPTQRLCEFVRAALEDVPGVASAEVSLQGAQEDGSEVRLTATAQSGADAGAHARDTSSTTRFSLDTSHRHYGDVVLQIADPQQFAPYEPFVLNYTGSLALLLENRQQRDQLRETLADLERSEQRYRGLFTEMTAGHAVHEIIVDSEGEPCDYRFLEMNPAFEQQTGLHAADIVGKTVCEVLPGVERAWIERYGHVALTGEPCHFDEYNHNLDRHYDVIAYRSAPGQFAAVFTDITERKRLEQRLIEAREKAERLQAEQRTVFERLQQTLLDLPQQRPGISFAHLYRSASKEAQVGGDFYDVFEAKNGRVGLLIGDVCGHGVEAARTAMLVKDTVRAFARHSGRPHVVLRDTNRLLIERYTAGFVTAFVAFLDPASGRLTFSSAGHPAPLLLDGEESRFLEGFGVPLGVFPDARYRDTELSLSPPSILVLYTDGVTEARRGDLMFGEDGLTAAAKEFRDHPVGELPGLLFSEALAFSQGELADDAALLVVQIAEPTRF